MTNRAQRLMGSPMVAAATRPANLVRRSNCVIAAGSPDLRIANAAGSRIGPFLLLDQNCNSLIYLTSNLRCRTAVARLPISADPLQPFRSWRDQPVMHVRVNTAGPPPKAAGLAALRTIASLYGPFSSPSAPGQCRPGKEPPGAYPDPI